MEISLKQKCINYFGNDLTGHWNSTLDPKHIPEV